MTRTVMLTTAALLMLGSCKKDKDHDHKHHEGAFTVPADGGSFEVEADGVTVTFTFPASAAGQEVTLTPSDAATVGFKEGDFLGVIDMQPHGLTFSEPVRVKADNPNAVFASFETSSSKPTEPEALLGDSDGFRLEHFSWLAIADIPNSWCDPLEDWSDVDGARQCANQGANTSWRAKHCFDTPLCADYHISCCVEPGGNASDGCDINSPLYVAEQTYNPEPTHAYCTPGAGDTDTDTNNGPCFTGGSDAGAPAADGTCGDPIIIDLSNASPGDVVTHTTNSNQGETGAYFFYDSCTSDFSGAGNRFIFQVKVPTSAAAIDVSVDAEPGVDPFIGILEDPSCQQPINVCGEANGAGECEYARGSKGQGHWFGSPFVIVGEAVDSGKDLTVRFKLDP